LRVIGQPMNPQFRLRLVFLVIAMTGMAGLTLWGVHASGRRIDRLERRLTSSQLESFRLADEFQQRLLTLNNAMLRYAGRREPQVWTEFAKASANLDQWIDEEYPKLNTDHERALLNQINAAYDDYLEAARRVPTNQQPAAVSSEAFTQINQFERQANSLLTLGTELAHAHDAAKESFLGEANQALGYLRAFLFGGVVLLLLLAGALCLLLYRDIIAPLRTRLVRSQQLLERQEKLATLGTLAAGIAHEIRNPLTSIKARLYTHGKHIQGNDAAIADVAIISSEIARLEHIVQDVLHFARPSEPKLEVVRADAPLREVQTLMTASLEKSNVQLVAEPGPELFVSMDVALIKEVLINLVRNAAEAIEREGTITLRVRADVVHLRDRSTQVAILEVADTGKGILPEVQKRLFDPFFSTKETGTGLGLPISARIVEKHNGALQFQTQPGRGTTFGVALPIVPAPTARSLGPVLAPA
jgi:signal transduction histidine kinase